VPAPEDPLVLQGKWLREQLTERGWTAEQLVQEAQAWAYRNSRGEIGMTRSYVSEWLWGKRGISVRYAEILAGVFEVPASQFVDSRALSAQGRLEALADKGESIVLRRDFGRLVGAGALIVLLPQDPFGSQLTRPEDNDPTRAIREQLMRYDSISGSPATSVDTNLLELQRRVHRAWHSFQSSRYSALGGALPGLLRGRSRSCGWAVVRWSLMARKCPGDRAWRLWDGCRHETQPTATAGRPSAA
jgi:transcriptional regulator with XRE-family HTH domain